MGRKNWLFCNTTGWANSSALIFSIIEAAKENSLKPFEYLEFLFENIRGGNDAYELVTWSENFPTGKQKNNNCRPSGNSGNL